MKQAKPGEIPRRETDFRTVIMVKEVCSFAAFSFDGYT
jgi:hypothetical protein